MKKTFLILVLCSVASLVSAGSFITLGEIVKRHSLRIEQNLANSLITLKSPTTTINLLPNLAGCTINGQYYNLDEPICYRGGRLTLPLSFLKVFLWSTSNKSKNTNKIADGQFRVVLDAGHGGKDPGAMANGVREKDIVFAIVKKVGILLSKYANIKVFYTRDTDVFVPLSGRGLKANREGADLFVSVHANASASASVHGADFYYVSATYDDWERAGEMNKKYCLNKRFFGEMDSSLTLYERRVYHFLNKQHRAMAKTFASILSDCFKLDVGNVVRGVRQARFHVLRMSPCPAVLIETGFLTNKQEAKLLVSDEYQQKIAQAITDAIVRASYYWK